MRPTGLLVVVLGLVIGPSFSRADGPKSGRPTVDFARDVWPILQRTCLECHGPQKQRAKLRLDARDAAFRGSENGPVIVPGKAHHSELVKRISLPKGADGVMPDRGEPLSKTQIELIRAWIDQGATWPADLQTAKHWAYVKPTRPALPKVKDASWTRTAVDYFVLAQLDRHGLKPSPAAEPATLVRRLYLDLIGLPPTPDEVEAFVGDPSPHAYEKLVDRLLASPAFGERWARPWLDVARYADSHGFQKDDFRTTWPYRDWVIRALNADMPFDQFTIEQVAGDLFPGATLSQKIATGFHRCAPTNIEAGSEPEETRVNQVFDRLNTTATAWLGATLECAQCHDHKYDPFTQKEYYQLFAFFNSTVIEAERANPKVPGSIQFQGPYLQVPGDGKLAVPQIVKVDTKTIDKELAARTKKLTAELASWEERTRASLDEVAQVHVLDVADFRSTAGSPHKTLSDKSVLLVDDPPEKDTYIITAQTRLTGISGFKLEALTHPSLPGEGPGRGDAERPNFVLNQFTVKAGTAPDDAAQTVKLVRARADFSQTGYEVAKAIDGSAKTGWAIAPQFHKAHWAVFETERAVGSEEGTTFTFTLVQEFGKGRTLGRLRLSALVGKASAPALPAEIVAILRTPKTKRTPAAQARLLEYRLEQDEEVQRLRAQRARTGSSEAVTTLVMQELSEPRLTSLLLRGDYRTPGSKVEAGVPAVLHRLPDGPPNRLTLARWLIDRDNPLTARVTVNRWWAELFGPGIVRTPEDFGIKGEPPTHPELLDWLAVEFMDSGWSMKKLLRQVVLSATYRQASKLTPELRARDPENRLYARGARFRLEAELIRDNALAVAGLLSRKQFGPPIRPYQPDGLWNRIGGMRVEYVVSSGEDRHRRGIYVVWKRSVPYASFVSFDATARYACTVKRSRSNTPLQALTLLNDPVYVEAAMALARRVVTERPNANTATRIRHAVRLCLARDAREAEVETLQRLFLAQRAASKANPAGTKALFADFGLPPGIAVEDFVAWFAVGQTLLNLDEMITRQ